MVALALAAIIAAALLARLLCVGLQIPALLAIAFAVMTVIACITALQIHDPANLLVSYDRY